MITAPYLLVLNIALHRHDGRFWADPLWKKDLEAHLAEIDRLAIACPVVNGPPPQSWAPLAAAITVDRLPTMGRFAPLLAPIVIGRLWRAIGGAAIVHTAVAGWPYPLGWLAVPLARLRRRHVVLVVESAFWRLTPGAGASRARQWRAALWERINIRVIAASDISFFTTQVYRRQLHRGGRDKAHVLPAVWIDEAQLIDEARLAALAPVREGRLLFAGRLTRDKGVVLLLEAAERSGVAVDFVGEGELRGAVLAASRRIPQLVRLLDPVGYGPAFNALLDHYAALVVPTLSDEQPRVIFDAFARGLTVLASATAGNRQVVEEDRTGVLFAVNDVEALAAALAGAQADPARLTAAGMAARRAMAGQTHAAMHAQRAALIVASLPTS